MEVRTGRRSRDNMLNTTTGSPERIKICTNHHPTTTTITKRSMMRPVPSFKRVQVVYYLSRNGQLEHPHYIEVTHLANQQLRLKDVIDRLIAVRGKGMPSLYSWSCKRSYKNGYVWNDLSENDIIHPSEGAEYILKGSEVTIDGSISGKFQQIQLLNTTTTPHHLENFSFHPKQKPTNHSYEHHDDDDDDEEEDHLGADEEYEEKIRYSYTASGRCPKGVSTDDGLHQQEKQRNPRNPTTEINLENSSSPPSTTSSSLSDKGVNENNSSNMTSKRFEDGDPLVTRNSMLFQILACGGVGGSLSFRGKQFSAVKQQPPPSPPLPPPPPTAGAVGRRRRSSCSDLHKEVFYQSLGDNKKVEVNEEEDVIKCMSENPRFGNMQSEEKEYFSGSIVDSISNEERLDALPSSLKKSSSYNEERGSKLAQDDAVVAAAEADQGDVKRAKRSSHSKSKCMPKIKSPYSSKQQSTK